MKTDYKILWIDDEHRYVSGDVRNIRSLLESYGVELTVNPIVVTPDHCPTKEASFSSAIEDIDLDMVFVDFNMPEQGDKIIRHIRDTLHHYHLPILFYTGNELAEQTLQEHIVASNKGEKFLANISDGIYFCHRDHIFDKAKLILTSLLKKENKAQNGRGLLMDRVSEVDVKLITALKVLWRQVPEEKREKVINLNVS